MHCCLFWSCRGWIRASWPELQQTDGVLLLAGLQLKPVCVCVCASLSVQVCACLPGLHPRSEICVWCLVARSRGSTLSTIWHLLPEMGKKHRESDKRDGWRLVVILSLSVSAHHGTFVSRPPICLFVSNTWMITEYKRWEKWREMAGVGGDVYFQPRCGIIDCVHGCFVRLESCQCYYRAVASP